MKVIIAGSRDIEDYSLLIRAIKNSMFDITEVVCGCARGADTLGETWAIANNIPIKKFPADWNTHGKKAGPIRNAQMGDYADCAIVLWDSVSKGSKNMIDYMNKLNKPCYIQLPLTALDTMFLG